MIPRKLCCFTGHRELPDEGSQESFLLHKSLLRAVHDAIADGATGFVNGGACGFDLLAAEAVLECRKMNPLLELRILIPYAGQPTHFFSADKKRYARVLAEATHVHVMSEQYYTSCMRARNERLVLYADMCIAYLRKQTGGTLMTVNMAARKGIPIVYL